MDLSFLAVFLILCFGLCYGELSLAAMNIITSFIEPHMHYITTNCPDKIM